MADVQKHFRRSNEEMFTAYTALLHAAKLGEVYFKYGKKQRMLESAYLVLDSCDGLGDTPLGKKILELQTVYSRI